MREGHDLAAVWRDLLRVLPPLCLGALLMAGCGRARAETVPSLPPLQVPEPPPRILIPVEVVAEGPAPLPEPEPVPEEPPQPPVRPRVAAPVSTGEGAPPEEAPKALVPVTPPPTLQTTSASAPAEVERAIRATMMRASSGLTRIDYRALNAEARAQYDTAKRFIEQAEDAIRLKNLPFAKNLADKAATLAVQLAGQ
jgi:hypothetical protein